MSADERDGEPDDGRRDEPQSPFRTVLLNPQQRRLRAGWRLVAAMGLLVAALVAGVPLAERLGGVVAPALVRETLVGLGTFVPSTAALLVAARLLDRRTLREFGLPLDRDWWADLGAGLALGLLLPAVIFAVEYALGYLRVTAVLATPAAAAASGPGSGLWTAVGLSLVSFVGVGVFEELLFRGYLLTNVAEGLVGLGPLDASGAVAVATGATSLLFGLAHGLNPNATGLAVAVITLYGGLLAAGYLLTARLALPIGLHVTWNFAVASVFGFPVSGLTVDASLLVVEQSGPPLLTGGSFGPEGGLISLLSLAVGTALLLAWVRWRDGRLRIHPDVSSPPSNSSGGPTE